MDTLVTGKYDEERDKQGVEQSEARLAATWVGLFFHYPARFIPRCICEATVCLLPLANERVP